MNTQQARDLGQRVAAHIQAGQDQAAYALLSPVLAERTHFAMLDHIGWAIGSGPLPAVNAFLARVASDRTEGGWVIIASALWGQWERDPAGALQRCRTYITTADKWYATDILGERVPGPSLVSDFQTALDLLTDWRQDPDRWVRRTTGVAVHFWAKRSRGMAELSEQAQALLAYLEPLFEEQAPDAVKGVGWGLKTLGRHYPTLVADWLIQQVKAGRRNYRALMLRKALTFLPPEQRARVTAETKRS